MKKIIIAIAIIIVLVAIGWYCRFILGLASQIAAPNVSTLDKEISWEKEHGLWGNYDFGYHCNLLQVRSGACIADGRPEGLNVGKGDVLGEGA